MADLTTEEWNEGYEACEQGKTVWENPYEESAIDGRDWRSGWLACDFDDRAAEQIHLMEARYA